MATIRNSVNTIDGIKASFEQEYRMSFEECVSITSSMGTVSTSEASSPRVYDRLSRLSILTFEGLPQAFFHSIARHLKQNLKLKDRRVGTFSKTKLRNCFSTGEANALLLQNGFATTGENAQSLVRGLVHFQCIENLGHKIKDDDIYGFLETFEFMPKTDDHVSRRSSVLSISASMFRESMLLRNSNLETYPLNNATDDTHALLNTPSLAIIAVALQKTLERRNKLLFHKGKLGCFLGSEAVAGLQRLRLAESLIDAILIAQALVDEGHIVPFTEPEGEHVVFQNHYVLYRLAKLHLGSN